MKLNQEQQQKQKNKPVYKDSECKRQGTQLLCFRVIK